MGSQWAPSTGQTFSGGRLSTFGEREEVVAAGAHTLGSCRWLTTHSMTVHLLTRAGQDTVKAQMRWALNPTNTPGPTGNTLWLLCPVLGASLDQWVL